MTSCGIETNHKHCARCGGIILFPVTPEGWWQGPPCVQDGEWCGDCEEELEDYD